MRGLLFSAAAAAALAIPAAGLAQSDSGSGNNVRMEPIEAKQCAVWASAMVAAFDDPEIEEGLLFAINYFVGYYEGATGRGIGDLADRSALREPIMDIEGFAVICGSHMENFGGRMTVWGTELTQLGDQLGEKAR